MQINLPSASTRLVILIGLIAAVFTGEISARPPQARTEFGTVAAADANARVIRLQLRCTAIPLTLVWNQRTRIFHGADAVSTAHLTLGTPVKVWYRTPIFGERFATKITIEKRFVGCSNCLQTRSAQVLP